MKDAFSDEAQALKRAMELFVRSGYHEVSVRDLVRCTGLSRHAIYGRFGSKSGLLATAVRHYRSELERLFDEALDGPGPIGARLRRLFELQGDGSGGEAARLGCLAVRLSAELRRCRSDLAAGLLDLSERLVERLAALLREGQARGEVGNGTRPEALARMLMTGFLLPLVLSPGTPCPADGWLELLEIEREAVAPPRR